MTFSVFGFCYVYFLYRLINACILIFMGSGKGRARRAQQVHHAVGNASEILVDEEKWGEFVDSGGLADVPIYGYYLQKNASKLITIFQIGELPDDADMKVVRELFADAVSVGAIVLPESYDADDFEFGPGPDYDEDVLIRMRSRPELTDIVQNISFSLGANPLLGDQAVVDSFYEFLMGVRSLLEKANNK
jgi:hypothetical protein